MALPAPPAPGQERSRSVDPGTMILLPALSRTQTPSSMSPCQVPFVLRRMTLTAPRSAARSELVAQYADAACLCGMVTRIPSTFAMDDETRHHDAEAAVGHLHRDADAVAATACEGVREPDRGLNVPDRVANDREEAAGTAELAGHVDLVVSPTCAGTGTLIPPQTPHRWKRLTVVQQGC